MALLGAPYLYDISSLRVNVYELAKLGTAGIKILLLYSVSSFHLASKCDHSEIYYRNKYGIRTMNHDFASSTGGKGLKFNLCSPHEIILGNVRHTCFHLSVAVL